MAKLTEKEKSAVAQAVKHAKLVEGARKVSRMVQTVHPSQKSLERRARLEQSLADWLMYYMPDTFPDPWGSDHIELLTCLQSCIWNGGSFCVLIARGGGKSAIGKGSTVYAGLTGRRKYVVSIGATDKLALEYLEFAKNQLDGDNERIAEDYPEAVGFFRALDGKAIKGMFQLDTKGNKTGIRWGAQGITYPMVLMPDGETYYPFSGCRMECRGITSAMKGMAKTIGGKIIRPDFVLPDDVQTEDDALSDLACGKIENKILGTVLALAGPRRRIACFMPMTKVRAGDVACRFSDRKIHPEFQGKRYPMFASWPDAQETLWKEYGDIRRGCASDAEGKRQATKFYIEHRDEMDAGAKVSWDSRVRAGETSAIETAENLLLELGKSRFMAEMQQEPLEEGAGTEPYTLTVDTIRHQQEDRQAFVVPPWCVTKIASTDMNPSYALTSAIVGFGRDQTAAVIWYGLFKAAPLPIPSDLPSAERHRRVFEALVVHGKQLASSASRPDIWHIDASGEYFPTVMRFTERSMQLCGIPAIGCTGVGAKNYRTGGKSQIGQAREYCQMRSDVQDNMRRKWFAWHADYWKEIAQRAWLGSVGSPGSVSLFKGNHNDFAEQIVREKLRGKGDVGGMTLWNWGVAPGPHDYGDVMAQAFAAAAWQGIGTSGPAQRQAKYVEARKCKVTREN